jgi:hypothetical protein
MAAITLIPQNLFAQKKPQAYINTFENNPNYESDNITQQFSNLMYAPQYGIFAPLPDDGLQGASNAVGDLNSGAATDSGTPNNGVTDIIAGISPAEIDAANESMQNIGQTGIYNVFQAGLVSNATVDTELNYMTKLSENSYEFGVNAMSSALSQESNGGLLGMIGL